MTVFLRDMSDNDTNEDVTGYVGVTHKATEGTYTVHQQYGRRMNMYRNLGVPILGAYHVVRTPGSYGHGSLQAQVNYWFNRLDSETPWWRSFPGFVLQIDGELWSYDTVSADTIKSFASLVKALAPVNCWVVTYASHGMYGNSLSGIATPLWNANYLGSTYLGDGAVGWNAYSGQTPVLWQYTSTPYDKNAFRGSLSDLLTMIGGNDMAMTDTFVVRATGETKQLQDFCSDLYGELFSGRGGPFTAQLMAKLNTVGAPSQDQVSTAVAAVMNDPAWIAKLAAAVASHVKVS